MDSRHDAPGDDASGREPGAPTARGRPDGPATILAAFLKLGVTAFGGPIAHLGYFRAEFVDRRRWLSEASYAELVGLCQVLPGPASSQVGFAIGLARGGLLGGLAAWLGFTLPSALALTLFALGAGLGRHGLGAGALHGLKLVAVAVVTQAVWRMARALCPDRERASLAVAATLVVLVVPGAVGQAGAILLGAGAGWWLCRDGRAADGGALPFTIPRRLSGAALATFALLLGLLPLAAALSTSHTLALVAAFYRSGALVFGGGHVVLPLLQAAVVPPGWVSTDAFLAGYGAAQAVPGPLFTFAAYLGAVMGSPPTGALGALVCVVSIFLPGLLLILGVLPFWDGLRRSPTAQAILRGVNASVVGVLLAALFDPVWTSAVHGPADFALALVAFVLLAVWAAPPWLVVGLTAGAGAMLGR